MTRGVINISLIILLALVVILTWTMRRDFTERNLEILPGMVESIPYDGQAENPNFSDRKTLREPVAGTIPVHLAPLHFNATPEEAVRAGDELRNPIPDTLDVVNDKGAAVFATFCQPCHGAAGLGNGPVVQHGFPPPPSLLAEKSLKLKDGQMFHSITYGQGNMPSLASQVSREERWLAINHVRSLQKKNISALSKTP